MRYTGVTYSLGERLATSGLTQCGIETERLRDRQVGYEGHQYGNRGSTGGHAPFMVYIGVPTRCSAKNTWPRRTLRTD